MSIEYAVLSVMADTLGREVALQDSLGDLGLDSLDLIETSLCLEEQIGPAASLGGDDLAKVQTLQDLVDLITSRSTPHA